jgi:hypothetical protein
MKLIINNVERARNMRKSSNDVGTHTQGRNAYLISFIEVKVLAYISYNVEGTQ